MVFTSEQDAFILMAHFRSGTRNPDGTWSYSLQSCIEQFSEAFPDVNIEYDAFKKHRLRLIARYENKYCICKGKSTGRPTVLTEEVVNDIQQRIQQSPKKSIPQLSAQTGTFKSLSIIIEFSGLNKLPNVVSSKNIEGTDRATH
ncbi:hypothetical protein RI129_003666 [Pyrocoelia pectoralis]|uniref:Uncharacterized protein n=1 Tax=Pyrocoelia pectoralis TaxID=417401 RepID=A0AAN7VPV8_9COLE